MSNPQLVRDLDTKTFILFYEGIAEDGGRSIGLAVSRDGQKTWEKYPQYVDGCLWVVVMVVVCVPGVVSLWVVCPWWWCVPGGVVFCVHAVYNKAVLYQHTCAQCTLHT